MRIMAIDDEAGILEVFERFLPPRGYELKVFSNSKKALEEIEHGALAGVDLVVLDLRMPDVDGRRILKKVKESGDTPVLILTGSMEASMAAELGADDIMFKPVKMEELLEKIQEMTRR